MTMTVDNRVFCILTEIFMAFGHGAGPLRVEHAAIEAATDRYKPIVEQYVDQWDTTGRQVREFASALGRFTAARVLADARTVITIDDFVGASHSFGPHHLIECPFCLQ